MFKLSPIGAAVLLTVAAVAASPARAAVVKIAQIEPLSGPLAAAGRTYFGGRGSL